LKTLAMASALFDQQINAMTGQGRAGMSAVVIRNAAELEDYVEAWEDLAAHALEPNIFYEPWMLLPAIRLLAGGRDLLFVLIFASSPSPGHAAPALCGLFPLERSRAFKGLPVRTLRLWKHLHCYLCTPLVRADCARQSLEAFIDWLDSDEAACELMEFTSISGDGPFHDLLKEQLGERDRSAFVYDRFTRALIRPAADAGAYLSSALSGKRRRQMKRKEKRLSEAGRLEYSALEPNGDAGRCVEEFLKLEAAGWKGEQHSAMSSTEADREFFKAITSGAFERGRLMMIALRLDGRPLAVRCSFTAGAGSFAFKTAFDEDYAQFSPGVLLEIYNIRLLHETADVRWMDCCCASDNETLNRLCADHRTVESLVVAARSRTGRAVVSLLPLLKRLNQKILHRRRKGR
jgi:CelD/BcsL family acetyltransferase involved in cellulose biosynthesis